MQGMQSDFSWGSSADKYIEVYKAAMGHPTCQPRPVTRFEGIR